MLALIISIGLSILYSTVSGKGVLSGGVKTDMNCLFQTLAISPGLVIIFLLTETSLTECLSEFRIEEYF